MALPAGANISSKIVTATATALAIAASLASSTSCVRDTKPVADPEGPSASVIAATAIDALCSKAELAQASNAEVRALLKNPAVEARARAALAMGRLADADSIPALAELLSHDGADGKTARVGPRTHASASRFCRCKIEC